MRHVKVVSEVCKECCITLEGKDEETFAGRPCPLRTAGMQFSDWTTDSWSRK